MPIANKDFRRFQSKIVSFRQVVSEISSLVPGSYVQQSGWSSAAPFTPKRKRITSADRRVLLESFVSKYRAMNSGKFPTPTSAQKEVGGGYYTIKKMLQEMEYNFKLSSMEKVTVKETKKQNQGEDTVKREMAVKSSRSQQVSNRQIIMNRNLYEDAWLESIGNLDKSSEGKEGLQSSTSGEDAGNNNMTRDDTRNIATKSHDGSAQCQAKPEQYAKDASHSEDKFGFQDSGSKVEQQDDGIRNMTRDKPESQKDEELREKASSSSSSSSIWGNLKSLASGFINIWK